MNAMTHRGYYAAVEYSGDDECFVGRVVGISDIVTFHGDSVDELKRSFAEAVDFYIENTTKDGRPAQKPYSGRMMLRVPPEVHAQASISAALGGKSLNQWVADVIRTAAHA